MIMFWKFMYFAVMILTPISWADQSNEGTIIANRITGDLLEHRVEAEKKFLLPRSGFRREYHFSPVLKTSSIIQSGHLSH